MMILPALLLLGTFSKQCFCGRSSTIYQLLTDINLVGAGIVSFCVAREVSEDAPGSVINPPFCHNVQQTMYSLTVVTTAIATAMICYKTWSVYAVYVSI